MLTADNLLFKVASLAALALTASCADVPSDNNLWKVPARLKDGSQELAWQQLPANGAVKVDVASADGRKFSHYPFIYNVGGTLYLLFSASANDVDGMGQDVRIASSTDAGITWTKPEVAFPSALLPNQTSVEDSKSYCDQGIPQRALQPLTIAFLPGGDEGSFQVFAVAQSSDNICPGYFQSAGRIARELDVRGSGLFKGDPCWIETNDYTGAHEWAETVYGTQYQMKVCDNKDVINAAISQPDNLGPVATELFNAPIIASDGQHNVSYPTKAEWVGAYDDGYWQRFWSDVSVRNTTGSAWVEYSTDKDGKNWYPATTSGSAIRETNIYQVAEKAHYGAFSGSEQLRYYVSNAGMNDKLDQIILTVATSRGDDPAFNGIGIVRGGDAGSEVSAGTRPAVHSGLPGFYWPSAAEVGDKLAIAYSENRQAIWVSVLNMTDLP
ncbi:putative glycosyl hydrolase, five-bladed beta-propellor domain superfamily [Septoria linicola]|nr:putative glycosyl hydrolase, five-bladed beta-propellor domain superfamily [Septoria linicola]